MVSNVHNKCMNKYLSLSSPAKRGTRKKNHRKKVKGNRAGSASPLPPWKKKSQLNSNVMEPSLPNAWPELNMIKLTKRDERIQEGDRIRAIKMNVYDANVK